MDANHREAGITYLYEQAKALSKKAILNDLQMKAIKHGLKMLADDFGIDWLKP